MTVKITTFLSRVLPLGVGLLLTGTCAFVIPNGVQRSPIPTVTSIRNSMWEVDLMYDLEGDGTGERNSDESRTNDSNSGQQQHKKANQIEIIRYNNRAQGKRWCPFFYHLQEKYRDLKNPMTKALHIDDELKRMESRYHQLGSENLPQINFPLSYGFRLYEGNIVRPSEQVYELVARAYSKASLGQDGVIVAEDLIARYEQFNPSQFATTKMMAFVMKTCIAAGNLKRAEHWLQRIERRYEVTQRLEDLPGYYVYNPFILGLRNIPGLYRRDVAKRSMKALEKIALLSKTTKHKHIFPGRNMYLEVMKYQEEGYHGEVAFDRIVKVFRLLQQSYLESDKNPKLKPTVEALALVFVAASKCSFPREDKIIKKVNALFDEYDELYKETGDIDFCPNAIICNSLNSMYARLNRHRVDLTDFTKRTLFLVDRMEQYNVTFKDPRDKTAVFNRILHAAEYQLPDYPMSDPVKTKELFLLVLDIFKKFHAGDSQSVPPSNKATYQIFLRACAKLPEGETRFKLSKKGFQLCQEKGFVTVDTVNRLYEANPVCALSLLETTDNLGFEEGTFDFETSSS